MSLGRMQLFKVRRIFMTHTSKHNQYRWIMHFKDRKGFAALCSAFSVSLPHPCPLLCPSSSPLLSLHRANTGNHDQLNRFSGQIGVLTVVKHFWESVSSVSYMFYILSVFFKTISSLFSHTVGHGQSEGDRMNIKDFQVYIRDSLQHVDLVKSRHPDLPVFIVGHSMVGRLPVASRRVLQIQLWVNLWASFCLNHIIVFQVTALGKRLSLCFVWCEIT